MARKKRSQKELAVAADRLHREVRAFTLLVNALIAPPRPLPPVAQEAVRDAFLAQGRRLAHFLHPVRPRADDVLAADFFPSAAQWSRLRLPASEGFRALREAPGGGPMTYRDAEAPPPPDPRQVVEIANEISAGVSIFLRHAPKGALGARWTAVRREE